MTFPAWQHFDMDRGVTPTRLRVYGWCRAHLDFCDVRPVKRAVVSHALHLHESEITRALSWLIEAGYLVEHPRGPHEPRRLTLAWSIRSQTLAAA